MLPRYEYGQEVRVTRNVRNDGTYPGLEIGDHLVKRGSVGYVTSVGTFLQDQVIYGVHFLEADKVVGCREEELVLASEPWIFSKFEFRDKVISKISLSIEGEVIVSPGDGAEIIKVLRDHPQGVHYHARFPGRTLLVPENVLDFDPKYQKKDEPKVGQPS